MQVDDALYSDLITTANKLATVSDQAATILSEEFEDLVLPTVGEMRAVLAKCPAPTGAWDGTLKDEDIEESTFPSPAPQGETRKGINLKHKITGIQRQSYNKLTEEENRAVARKSLEQAVAKRFEGNTRVTNSGSA